jgi:glycosyltransferase involved in cell wall biosynthesis
MSLAREKGVKDRLEVTGYLPDEEFRRRLSIADLAVCPFSEHKSASGSLSALIAIGCPILASDIPLVAEYNAMVPDAIATFSPYTAEALAASIGRLLTMPRAELTDGLAKLRKLLSIATIYNQHIDAYQQVLRVRQTPDASGPRHASRYLLQSGTRYRRAGSRGVARSVPEGFLSVGLMPVCGSRPSPN